MIKEEGEDMSEEKPPTLQYARPRPAVRSDPMTILGYIVIAAAWLFGATILVMMLLMSLT